MSTNSKIEWTNATWNPLAGCKKVSAGCDNCYAMRLAYRLFNSFGQKKYAGTTKIANRRAVWSGRINLSEKDLEAPLHWRKPKKVFVNSMSDLFNKDVPLDFIQRVFAVMARCPQHRFQVLTKRAERLAELAAQLDWSPNIWMGVSVENSDFLLRVDCLRTVPARIRFLSLEPLLGPVTGIDLNGIHWVVVGGESGPGARPMQEAWVLEIRDKCANEQIPFFFKQWGGNNKKKAGRLLSGRTHDDMPERAATQRQDESGITDEIPLHPEIVYKDKGWKGWDDLLGTGK